MKKKTILAILVHSHEKQFVDVMSCAFLKLAEKSCVGISIDCQEIFQEIEIGNEELFNSIIDSASKFMERKNDFELAVIADSSIEGLKQKTLRLNEKVLKNDQFLLVSMLLFDGRTFDEGEIPRTELEQTFDSFFDYLKQQAIKSIRVHNSVIVYQTSMPVVHRFFSTSHRFCLRLIRDDHSPLALDAVTQFTNYFQLFYSNPRALRNLGKRRPVTVAAEISNFLNSATKNWDFYFFTGSVVSTIIDTFEKLKSSVANGYCLSGPSEHSLACGAIANWQLYQRSYAIVVTSGMGDELKGTLQNLKQSKARGFVIVAESNPGVWFPFQGCNYEEDDIVSVMEARDLPVVSFTDSENMHEDLTKAFTYFNQNKGPVVLLLSTKVLMATEQLETPIQISPVTETIQYDDKDLDDIVNIINNEKCRVAWRCGFLSDEEYQLVKEISEKAGIVLVDGLTRPGSIPAYKNGVLTRNYFGTFSLYGYSKKIYRYLTDKGKVRDKNEQILFFLKSKISQISSPFSEASLKNKFRIVQVNNNPSHLAPFADYHCQMNLLDFLILLKSRLDISNEVLEFRRDTINKTTIEKDTFSKSIPVQPMFPNYFFTQLSSTVEQLITKDEYSYTGIYDVGRNGVSAFRNIARTGPGFSGWYGRALMGDALLAVNSLAVTSENNILAFIGDGAKNMVPDIRATMVDNILHQRKNLDINISIFYLINGVFSLICSFQESFLYSRSRRPMNCHSVLESESSFDLGNIRVNQHVIEKYDHHLFDTALRKKGEINLFYVLLSHNNSGDGLSLASIKSYSWQDD